MHHHKAAEEYPDRIGFELLFVRGHALWFSPIQGMRIDGIRLFWSRGSLDGAYASVTPKYAI